MISSDPAADRNVCPTPPDPSVGGTGIPACHGSVVLKRLKIRGFGMLRDANVPDQADRPAEFEEQRINLFIGDNETGKTTFAAALFAGLYGVGTDRRRRPGPFSRPFVTHWQPFDRGAFGLELTVHRDGRPLVLVWDFAGGGLVARDGVSGEDLTKEFHLGKGDYSPGRAFFDLSPEEFAKVCLVRQSHLADSGHLGGLSDLVQRIADTEAGDRTVATALHAIERARREHEGRLVKKGMLATEIKRLREAVAEKEEALAQAVKERDATAKQEQRYQALTRVEAKLRAQMEALEFQEQAAELREVEAEQQAGRDERKTLADLHKERDSLRHLEDFPANRLEHVIAWQTKRDTALRNATDLEEKDAAQIQPALEGAQRSLRAFGPIAAATRQARDDAYQRLTRAQDAEGRLDRIRDEAQAEQDALERKGIPVAELGPLQERLSPLDQEGRAWVAAYELARLQRQNDMRALRHDLDESAAAMNEISAKRRAAARTAAVIQVVGGALILGAAALFLAGPEGWAWKALWAAVAAGGVAAFVHGRTRTARSRVLVASEYDQAEAARTTSEEKLAALDADRRADEERARALAARAGYAETEDLLRAVRQLDTLQRECKGLVRLREQENDATGVLEGVAEHARPILAQFDRTPRPGQALSEALGGLAKAMDECLKLRGKAEQLEAVLAADRTTAGQERRAADENEGLIADVLRSAGLAPAGDVARDVAAFREAGKQHRRLRALQDELIPQAEQRVKDLADEKQLTEQIKSLHRQVDERIQRKPEFARLDTAEAPAEYRQRRGELRGKLDEARTEREGISVDLLPIRKAYDQRIKEVEEELEELRPALDRAERNEAALALARDVLEEVGKQVHGRWARELNRTANEVLERVACPAPQGDPSSERALPSLHALEFDPDLNFHVLRRSDGRRVEGDDAGPILSAGQRDQVYLAVRLAIASFLGTRGAPAPLILDDPFVNFDDGRFAAAMRFFAESVVRGGEGRTGQVILLSCHRQRYAWLRSLDPEWYDRHVAEQEAEWGGGNDE